MAPCCTNVVTPKMIKKGQIKVGDRIQLEEILAEAPVISADPPSEGGGTPSAQSATPAATIKGDVREGEDVLVQAAAAQGTMQVNTGTGAGRVSASNANPYTVQMPIGLEDMTSYMDQVTYTDINGTQMITVPQSPLTPQDYEENIEVASVQAYAGFLRTQMGRYMRVEQLVGSNMVEDRYGFLVGVGSNFILLQEITTGNLMVIDIFSIKLTYIYYSDPVLPNFVK